MSTPSSVTKLICFDLDDTLIDDGFKFETTYCDCMKIILQALAAKSPQIDEILYTAREMDNELIKTLPPEEKYSPERLVRVWQETYRHISEKKDIPIKKHILQMLEGYAWQNYEPLYFVIAGAVDTLIHIKNIPNVRLEVLTIGHARIQGKKITLSRLDHYFEHIEFVNGGEGKGAYLEKQVPIYGKENIYMVGNSMRSDINPALKAGVHAVYIPRGAWHHNEVESFSKEYVEVKRIFELGTYFEKEFASSL